MNIFTGSYITTIICLIAAYIWGEHMHPGTGLTCVFIAAVLGILEVSLSFDNAVVNAAKLEKMTPKWQQRFRMLKQHGCKKIKFMAIIAAPQGVQKLAEAHPDVEIYVSTLDRQLNEHGYILPGLGDAGDRIFGTK